MPPKTVTSLPASRFRPEGKIVFAVAFLLRLLPPIIWPALSTYLGNRVEFSTPLSSFKRLQECVFLYQHGFPLYDGGLCHHPFLLVAFFALWAPLGAALRHTAASILFAAVDTWTAKCLMDVARICRRDSILAFPHWGLVKEKRDAIAYEAETDSFSSGIESTMLWCYAWNPIALLCVWSFNATAFSNALIVSALVFALKGKEAASIMSLSLAGYLSIYPALLLPPTLLLINRHQKASKISHWVRQVAIFVGAVSVLLLWTALGVLKQRSSGSGVSLFDSEFMQFINGVYAFIAVMPDMTPNTGMYWYFFTELFIGFRPFFVGVVQVIILGFVVPLTFKFRSDPLFCFTIIFGMLATFKTYPSLSDMSLWLLGLMPFQQKLLPFYRQLVMVVAMLLVASILLPSFHHLWIYIGSGNANFFYASTLVWNFANVLLLTDSVFSWRKRNWEMACTAKLTHVAPGTPVVLG